MQRAGRQQAAPLPYHIPLEDVAVGERIGGGALGEVRVAVYDGNQVALKSLHMLRTDDAAQAEWGGALSPAERDHQLVLLIRECDTLRGLDHRNILPCIGVVVDRDSEPLFLATQFIPGGTLHDLIHHARYAQLRDEAGCLPLPTQLAVAHDIFSGLSYLAGKHLIHRDIKPANILTVTENGQLVKILLADFGESKQLTMTMTRAAGTVAGTPLYMAPEMHEEDDAKGPKADVFSAGVVLIEMGSGRQPNPGPQIRRRQLVPEEERRAEDMRAVHHSQIAELARRCIVDDEGARASAAELERLCATMRAELAHHHDGDGANDRAAEATVYVKLLDGHRVAVQATARTTVAELIGRVVAELGHQRLVFAGRRLDPSRTVDDYNLLDGTQIHMLTVTSGNGDAQAERQRREEVEALNAQLHAQNEELQAQVDTAVATADQERLRIARLERELAAAKLEGQGGGGGRSVSGESGLPERAIAAVAQHPPGAVLRVDNAGSTEVNGFYKENGAETPMDAHCTPLQCVGLIVATGAQGRTMARRSIARCEICVRDTRVDCSRASKVQVVTETTCDVPRSHYTTWCNEQIGDEKYEICCAHRLLFHETQRKKESKKYLTRGRVLVAWLCVSGAWAPDGECRRQCPCSCWCVWCVYGSFVLCVRGVCACCSHGGS